MQLRYKLGIENKVTPKEHESIKQQVEVQAENADDESVQENIKMLQQLKIKNDP
jgi:hypothetical protein